MINISYYYFAANSKIYYDARFFLDKILLTNADLTYEFKKAARSSGTYVVSVTNPKTLAYIGIAPGASIYFRHFRNKLEGVGKGKNTKISSLLNLSRNKAKLNIFYIYNKRCLHGGKTTMLYLNLSGH